MFYSSSRLVVLVVLPVILSSIVASMFQFLSKSLIFSSSISALSGVIRVFNSIVSFPVFKCVTLDKSHRDSYQ
jgi:hypothetical protein